MKEKVKVLKGMFKGNIGTIDNTFEYHGNQMRVVKFNGIYATTGQQCFAYTTVKDGEFEPTQEKETFRIVK